MRSNYLKSVDAIQAKQSLSFKKDWVLDQVRLKNPTIVCARCVATGAI
jgi:hypothetical protein